MDLDHNTWFALLRPVMAILMIVLIVKPLAWICTKCGSAAWSYASRYARSRKSRSPATLDG